MTMTHSRTGPRSTHRTPPATKAARSKPAKGGLKRGTVNDPKAEFSDEEWQDMVATAAYFRAESRGFEGGSLEDDWYEAEAELREQLARAEGTLDDLFKGFALKPVRFEQQMPQIKMDVKENNGAYVVHAEIPGVKKEDIKVDVEGNMVSISAEVNQEKEVKEGERVLRSERYFGKVYRAFALGSDVDEAATEARYADGILELKLPKKTSARVKRIAIQ